MRKKKLIAIMLLVMFMLTGCKNNDFENRTTYYKKELVKLDHFEIVCKDYSIIDLSNTQKKITINFSIKNNSNSSVDLLNNNFRIHNDDGTIILPTNVINEKLSKKEEKNINVEFEVENAAESYKILFYSNVVSNNVAFILDD